jgi:hypothetical protein
MGRVLTVLGPVIRASVLTFSSFCGRRNVGAVRYRYGGRSSRRRRIATGSIRDANVDPERKTREDDARNRPAQAPSGCRAGDEAAHNAGTQPNDADWRSEDRQKEQHETDHPQDERRDPERERRRLAK